MTLFAKKENKSCFIACEQSKIDSGLCDYINRILQKGEILPIQNVTNRYLFFYEGEEDGWTFEIKAKDYEEAFELAYDTHGPQVESMMYRQI